MLINDFRQKKVSDYLQTGLYKKVLILFHHGLGDIIQFYGCCYLPLVWSYPDIDFKLHVHCGQQEAWGRIDGDPSHYDIAFDLKYPCSEWGTEPITKAQRCNRDELGIDGGNEFYCLGSYGIATVPSSLVGIHCFSTCNPKMNCPEDISRQLWEQILGSGLIPIETHMVHANANRRKPYAHESLNVMGVPATLQRLFGLIASCRGFAGVSSGNFWTALATFEPRQLLFLRTDFSVRRMTARRVFEMDVRRGYDDKVVKDWLDVLQEGR